MLVYETHHSLDNPAEMPMFGLKKVCGKSTTCSSDLNAALTGMANSIVTALSPQMPVCPGGSGINSNSPSKNVGLCSKYMQ